MADEEEIESEEAKTLGLERWVQFAFVLIAGLTMFLSDKLIAYIWNFFQEPDETMTTGLAVVVGILTGFFLYRHPKVKPLADEVAGELSKVTWPARKETWSSTIVVIVTSIIAATYLGVFDALWGAFTDIIYATS